MLRGLSQQHMTAQVALRDQTELRGVQEENPYPRPKQRERVTLASSGFAHTTDGFPNGKPPPPPAPYTSFDFSR